MKSSVVLDKSRVYNETIILTWFATPILGEYAERQVEYKTISGALRLLYLNGSYYLWVM